MYACMCVYVCVWLDLKLTPTYTTFKYVEKSTTVSVNSISKDDINKRSPGETIYTPQLGCFMVVNKILNNLDFCILVHLQVMLTLLIKTLIAI